MRHAKRWAESRRPHLHGYAGESGSASLEFITAGLILLVPLVYLVVAMSALQGGSLAVEGAARQAARVYVQAPDEATAQTRAERAVQFALADYGLEAGAAQVDIHCTAATTGCLTRHSAVTVTVRISVALPLVPDVLSVRGAASVPVQATATQVVSRFWATQ
ncbi:hypothetical protein JF66_05370 [Cryobacterium sp. MLB-32]|uniref:hypothetical protein n=1 Tax=Cryobacterium sp. MLB-32 TaxID=1529318 RepID=UPI0004E71E72|nr:hypothetical protein [Cryobacterium sp. MLB-32]KFF60287.1 hypothetical protein JF66_05370 [Cryobacterium sp. MLB-32]